MIDSVWSGRVPADVRDRLVEVVDDPHRRCRGDRCSVAQSSSVAGTASGQMARALSSACTVTPDCASAPSTGGQQPLGRRPVHQHRLERVADARTLHLGVAHDVDAPTARRPIRRGTTCTTPAPVSITGTFDSVTTVSISWALPRGISTSTYPARPHQLAWRPRARTRRSVCTLALGSPTEAQRLVDEVDEHPVRVLRGDCRRAAPPRCRS